MAKMYSYKQGNSILTFLGIKHFTFFNLLLNDTILKHYVFLIIFLIER